VEFLVLVERIASLGGAGLLILAVLGVLRGWWVPRWLYDRESLRADAWERAYNRERGYNDKKQERREASP
jgi:hypothetical protein